MLRALFLFMFTTMLAGCGYPAGPLQFSERIVGAQAQQVSDELLQAVQKELLAPRCAGCHGWASTVEDLLTRITPGEPLQSMVYLRIEDGSMPPFGQSFNEEELERLAEAIRALKE